MIRIRHIAARSPWPGGYASDAYPVGIPAGSEVEVPEHVASYLLATYAEHFESLSPAGVAPPQADPPPDVLSSSGEGSDPAPAPGLTDILDHPLSELLPRLRAGEFDGVLSDLAVAESSGRSRATLLDAIDARARSTGG